MFDTLTSAQKIVLAAVVLLALVAAAVSASGRLRSAPDVADAVGYDPPISGKELVTVHVAGAVIRPGLYRIATGSRVQDAISAAGGFTSTARRGSVNLAAWLTDGEQVFVETSQPASASVPDAPPAHPTAASPPPVATPHAHMVSASAATPPPALPRPVARTPVATAPPASAPVRTSAPKPRVRINTAGLEELQQLPGIGPKLAMRILYYRNEKGRFRSFSQLGEVKGIGADTIERIRECATLN